MLIGIESAYRHYHAINLSRLSYKFECRKFLREANRCPASGHSLSKSFDGLEAFEFTVL